MLTTGRWGCSGCGIVGKRLSLIESRLWEGLICADSMLGVTRESHVGLCEVKIPFLLGAEQSIGENVEAGARAVKHIAPATLSTQHLQM